MNRTLLASASTLVLALAFAMPAAAQGLQANTGIALGLSDAVAGGQAAADDGAISPNGNALGQNANHNAVAGGSSSALQVESVDSSVAGVASHNSTAVDDGGYVRGNGAAVGANANDVAAVGSGLALQSDGDTVNDGSALHFGSANDSATAEEDSAAANTNSVALSAGLDNADEGSSVVGGDDNHTASADDGSAAVGGSGTAIGISDIHIGGEEFICCIAADNLASEEGPSASSSVNGFFGGGSDATLAFGVDNTVASAHLDSFITGFALALNLCDCDEQNTHITTGSIFSNSVSQAVGANRVVYNTGIANQGRALAVAAENSFGN